MDASKQMLDAVAAAKKQAKSAKQKYERASEIVAIKSRGEIDLNGGYAISKVADIVASVRTACDELYASCQSLVLSLDQTCRPLLEDKPSARAVKEVVEAIKWLNKESEIGTNFTGTFNGSVSGDLASVKYFPSMECRLIQKHWENVYGSMPGAAEEDRAFKQRKADELKAQREAACQEREWEREWARKEKEQKRQEEEKLEQERKARYEANSDEILSRREYLRPLQRMMWSSYDAVGFVKSDGTVDAFEKIYSPYGGTPGNVSRFSNIRSIVCTYDGFVGLREDGTCICTNVNHHVDSHIWEANQWAGVVELSAGDHHVVGLRKDGTCIANSIKWNIGYGYSGQSDVDDWRDITAIACGNYFTVGLKKDGTLVKTGGQANSWQDVALIAAGDDIYAALTHDGKVLSSVRESIDGVKNVENIVQLAVANHTVYALTTDGSVYGGRKLYDSDPDKNILVTSNALSITGGSGGLLVLKEDGAVERFGEFPGSIRGFAQIPDNYRLFESYEKLRVQKKLVQKRKESGVCRHCGGEFKKSLFGLKCTQCGERKDY